MGLTFTTTLACDHAACTATTSESLEAAEAAGWTYSASSYGVASVPPPAGLRCPTHKGQ